MTIHDFFMSYDVKAARRNAKMADIKECIAIGKEYRADGNRIGWHYLMKDIHRMIAEVR